MTAAVLPSSPYGLPWSIGEDESRRLRKFVTTCLLVIAVVGLVIPWLPVPEVEREELEALPPQLARIVMDKPEPVIPPPPKVEPKPKPEQKAVEPEPVPESEPKPEPEVQPKPVERPPTEADARRKAEVSGLLQFKDAFADMRDAVDVSKLNDTGAIQRGPGQSASIDRSLLTSKHASRSAGVNVAALSNDTGGVALSGRETTRVEAPPTPRAEKSESADEHHGVDRRQRSIEEIRRVFDSNKGAIFSIYNRALRNDPTLQGQLVLELSIDANGRVVDCAVVSSELGDEAVVAKIVNRVRLFDFGPRDVATTTISYPVHFLPT